MSWQAYADQMHQENVDLTAIFHCQSNQFCCNDPNFGMTVPEALQLIKVMNDKDERGKAQADGVTVAGKSWTLVRVGEENDELFLRGKGVNNKLTLVATLSDTMMIVGSNSNPDVTSQNVNNCVLRMKDHLKKLSY